MPPYNAPSWKALVDRLAQDAKWQKPAAPALLAGLNRALGVDVPDQLSELLLESNGLIADYGSGVIWPVGHIEKQNLEFRSNADFRELFMPFDHLLFFADDGGGNQFCFAIDGDGAIRRLDVFRWDHETDSREWYAGRLEQYLERRFAGAGS